MEYKLSEYLKCEILKDKSFITIIKEMLFCIEIKVLFYYRINKYLYDKKVKLIPYILNYVLNKRYGIFISLDACIGKGLSLPHAHNIVIGSGVVIGDKCKIYHNVTVGRKKYEKNEYATIGENVTLYPGTVIIGRVNVGNNVSIGANSCVTKDIESNLIMAGNPAKLIKILEN